MSATPFINTKELVLPGENRTGGLVIQLPKIGRNDVETSRIHRENLERILQQLVELEVKKTQENKLFWK